MFVKPLTQCFQCGNVLIETKRTVAFPLKSQSETTTITYRCSNTACQDRINAKIAAMTEARLEREQRDIAKAAILAETRLKAQHAKEQLSREIAKHTRSAGHAKGTS